MLNPLALSGALNFRDIGGTHTADGHTVRTGIIFRSAHLGEITPEDCASLDSLGIRFIFDLRTDFERRHAPTRWSGRAPEIIETCLGFDPTVDPNEFLKGLMGADLTPAHARSAMCAVYERIVTVGAASIGSVLRAIAVGQVPAVVHCSAGKDRTGIVVALLLTLLGVPEEAICADYLLTNQALGPSPEKDGIIPTPSRALPAEILRVLLAADQTYLATAFEVIRTRYGSMETYVKDGLGLSAEDVAGLRARLLTDGLPCHPCASRP